MTTLAGEPLDIEFFHLGEWFPAVLLGWRHDAWGTCELRVQFEIGGLKRAGWMALADVRLPQRQTARRTPPPAPWHRAEDDVVVPIRYDLGWDAPSPAGWDVPRPRTGEHSYSRA
ncbi:hypothetical protein A7K94_0200890 [Modestobacter sp. VKM Ac-2676]|nr:hypothetical protein A7K94_0200890 [Modestobacter sp. VKM Ac-2676]